MGDLTNFILVGHSFGGYLVGNYAVEYPQHIKKIVFISPIGIKPNFKNEDEYLPIIYNHSSK